MTAGQVALTQAQFLTMKDQQQVIAMLQRVCWRVAKYFDITVNPVQTVIRIVTDPIIMGGVQLILGSSYGDKFEYDAIDRMAKRFGETRSLARSPWHMDFGTEAIINDIVRLYCTGKIIAAPLEDLPRMTTEEAAY